jgi:hypothetical protein
VDPVTGLSRRSSVLLVVAVVLGVVVSTVATAIQVSGDPACPDPAYGCATFRRGEPIQIGAMFRAVDGPGPEAVFEAVDRRGGHLFGRPVRVVSWPSRCTPSGGAVAARELATDPPDGPPVVAIIAGGCVTALSPAAQIVSDSGITLTSSPGPDLGPPSVHPPYHLELPGAGEGAPSAMAEAVLDVVVQVAREGEDGALLVPRTALRDALLDRGLVPG